MAVFVDADAAPRDVVASTRELGRHYGIPVWVVSSVNHQLTGPDCIQVDAHPQATDLEIVKRLNGQVRALVITQDYGLAALALAKGAQALSPCGREYTAQNIDLLLFERELHAHERKVSGKSRGPRARTEADRIEFKRALQRVLSEWATQERK